MVFGSIPRIKSLELKLKVTRAFLVKHKTKKRKNLIVGLAYVPSTRRITSSQDKQNA